MDVEKNKEVAFEGKDIQLELITEDTMKQCAACKFRTGKTAMCKKYKRKPDGVILGEIECDFYEG